MASFGKKILSAFMEVTEDKKPVAAETTTQQYSTMVSEPVQSAMQAPAASLEKFKNYFDQLFKEANLPGPDYFEFAKMVEVMGSIADEKARYAAAFAGLNVQGLDKGKLLDTAKAYLQILETDAANFSSTVDAALTEKVKAKQLELENKHQRIEQLTREINDLQNQVQLLQLEVKENEEKIASNTGSYKVCSDKRKQQITMDIEKIKQHIN